MKKLVDYLQVFRKEQIVAFIDHDDKHPTDSVTNDETNWREYDLRILDEHLEEEFKEYQTKRDLDSLVDLANMCFLNYTVRKLQSLEVA